MLIRAGSMVKINGINGFGFVKEVVYCQPSNKTVLLVNVTLHNVMQEAELVTLDPLDVTLYHAEKSTAKRVLNTPAEHEFIALKMAA